MMVRIRHDGAVANGCSIEPVDRSHRIPPVLGLEISGRPDEPFRAKLEVLVESLELERVEAELYATIEGKRFRLVEEAS